MINIIFNADVLAKHLRAHALVETRTLVLQRRRCKVVEEKAHKVEHGRRFENHRIPARRKFLRIRGPVRLVARAFRQSLRIDSSNTRGVFLGPACRRAFLHRDGKHRMRIAIRRKQAPRIPHRALRLRAREYPRSRLALLDRQVTCSPYCTRAIFRCQGRGLFHKAIDLAIALPPGHRQ